MPDYPDAGDNVVILTIVAPTFALALAATEQERQVEHELAKETTQLDELVDNLQKIEDQKMRMEVSTSVRQLVSTSAMSVTSAMSATSIRQYVSKVVKVQELEKAKKQVKQEMA